MDDVGQFDVAPLGFADESVERLAWITAMQRYESAFGHVDVGTRDECCLKLVTVSRAFCQRLELLMA